MSGRWWRAYDEALHDPKLVALSDKLHRAWFGLLCVASKNDGLLPAMSTVAIELRVTVRKAAEYVTALVQAGLIDEIEAGKFAPHNWPSRQFQSDVTDPTNAERQRRYRKRHSVTADTVTVAVTAKLPETETETETETEEPSLRSGAGALGQAEIEVVGEDEKARLFRLGKTILASFGVAEKRTGALIGQWLKARNNDAAGVLAALQFARDTNVAEPVAYVSAIIHGKSKNGAASGAAERDEFERRSGESLGELGRRMAARAREHEAATRAQFADDGSREH